jgi:hypothetical protein
MSDAKYRRHVDRRNHATQAAQTQQRTVPENPDVTDIVPQVYQGEFVDDEPAANTGTTPKWLINIILGRWPWS